MPFIAAGIRSCSTPNQHKAVFHSLYDKHVIKEDVTDFLHKLFSFWLQLQPVWRQPHRQQSMLLSRKVSPFHVIHASHTMSQVSLPQRDTVYN